MHKLLLGDMVARTGNRVLVLGMPLGNLGIALELGRRGFDGPCRGPDPNHERNGFGGRSRRLVCGSGAVGNGGKGRNNGGENAPVLTEPALGLGADRNTTGERPRSGKLPIEDLLRARGYSAVRGKAASILTKPAEAGCVIDQYFLESGAYDAATLLLGELAENIEAINKGGIVVDLTCTTGQVAALILSAVASPRGAHTTFHANDVPEYVCVAKPVLDAKCGELRTEGRDASINYSSVDPAAELDVLRADPVFSKLMGQCSAVFWHDVHYFGGRKRVIANAFELLKPGGWFIVMDVFPSRTIPSEYVGAEDSRMIGSLLSGALDQDALRRKIEKCWMRAMFAATSEMQTQGLPSVTVRNLGSENLADKAHSAYSASCVALQKPESPK